MNCVTDRQRRAPSMGPSVQIRANAVAALSSVGFMR